MNKDVNVEGEKLKISESTLVDYCRGNIHGELQKQIEMSISSSIELQGLVNNIRIVVELENDIEDIEQINLPLAFERVRKRISPPKTLYWYFYRIAAILVLPLLVTSLVLAFLYLDERSKPITYSEIFTPLGTTMRYELSDGSIVWLNAGSKLRFPNSFNNDTREVELWGEGYFEVKADLKHPFYVKTENGSKVFAYGTRFNVNSYTDEEYIETVLEKGKVNIISPDGNSFVSLLPGERGLINKTDCTMRVEQTGVYEKSAWREGKMVFRNEPLDDILKKLSRHYNVDIVFKNHTSKRYFYRATFKNESIFQILDYLKFSAPIEWGFVESVQNSDSTFTKRLIEVKLLE